MNTKGFHVAVRIEFGSGAAILSNDDWITSVLPETGELAGGVEAFVDSEVLVLVNPPWGVRWVLPLS